jgi:transposase-like protein
LAASHERATPAEKARLLAYLNTGDMTKAAKRYGCCRHTISRTWDRYRRDIAEALGL